MGGYLRYYINRKMLEEFLNLVKVTGYLTFGKHTPPFSSLLV